MSIVDVLQSVAILVLAVGVMLVAASVIMLQQAVRSRK